ncbi:glycerol-3-phosphate dehydrogenase [Dermatophagoides farinae]|uniref:Glycerol-3-phosphate dehydrogenase [NAD(+)] n=1 Tax=Dermatophagoides farinae TaxID=6954 RepID=A0A922KY55_DERFA|nr:glycerol-3-phosphate dehydrogenase [Dermatophagoides farinae]
MINRFHSIYYQLTRKILSNRIQDKFAWIKVMGKKRVCIIGSAIAKIVGKNAHKYPQFETDVRMYVYEEIVDGRKLSEIINEQHENVKYLPGHKLPENIIADPDLEHTVGDADILVFVVPHAFVSRICNTLKGKINPNAIAISLIKGFNELPSGGIELISDVIRHTLGIDTSVLMGANLANEVAEQKFCETTIGCKCPHQGAILKDLFQTDDFRITVVPDRYTVEICGALKNVVACAAGFSDGLGYGDNTKAAVIRIGLKEMIRFCKTFYADGLRVSTFFESCGVADLITTCYGGRNRRVSEAFVKTGKTIEELETEMLNGQKLQGYQTCEEVVNMLNLNGYIDRFPLFHAVNLIYKRELPAEKLVEFLRREPDEDD